MYLQAQKKNKMNDDLKIKTLMMYYQHWGGEQNKIRKKLDGARQFQKLYEEHGFMMRMSCRSYLKRHTRRTIYHLLDILLTDLGCRFVPIEMLPESNNTRIVMLEQHIYGTFPFMRDETYLNLMNCHETDALSVDAIVALM